MIKEKLSWDEKYDIYIIFLLFFSFSLALKLNQYYSFSTSFEPADFELVLWNSVHGRILQMPYSQLSFLSEHFSPILLFIVPIYALVQSNITLIVLHTFATCAAVIPLFYLTKEFNNNRWVPIAFALAYFFSRTINYGLMYDIHMEVIYPIIFFCIFLAYKRSNWIAFYICLLLAFMVKEDAFIVSFGLGAYLLAVKKWKHGFITAGISLVNFIIVMVFIIPHFREQISGGDYKFLSYWSGYGSSQGEILFNFLNPVKHFEVIFTVEKLKKMFNMFSVFIFLPFFSWRAFLFLIVPGWFMLYSSDFSQMNSQINYYGMLITPFLFFASILGMESLKQKWTKKKQKLLIVLPALLLLVHLGNSRVFKQLFYKQWQIPERYKTTAMRIIDEIPVNVPISAQVSLVPHVPLHPLRSCFPFNLDATEYIFLDEKGNKWPLQETDYRRIVDSLKSSSDWNIIVEKDNFDFLKRNGNVEEIVSEKKSKLK